MKKVIKPKQIEEAIYFSDFSGKPFGQYKPPVELRISFNYGSVNDCSELVLHLDDRDVEPILQLISWKLNDDCKKQMRADLEDNDEQYEEAINSRDVGACEYYASTNNLIRTLLGETN